MNRCRKGSALEFKAHVGEIVCVGEDGGRWFAGRWVSGLLMENGSVEKAMSGRDREPRRCKRDNGEEPGPGLRILRVDQARGKRRRADWPPEESGRIRVASFEKDSRFRSNGL